MGEHQNEDKDGQYAVTIPEVDIYNLDQVVVTDIQELFARLFERYNDAAIDKALTLSIVSNACAGSSNTDIEFRACIGYDNPVETDSLLKSLDRAIERYKEDQATKPKQITFRR